MLICHLCAWWQGPKTVAWGLTGVLWKGCRHAVQYLGLSLCFNHLYGMKTVLRQQEWLSEKQCFSSSSFTEKCKTFILTEKWVCIMSGLNSQNITCSSNFYECTHFSVKCLRTKINPPVVHANISMWLAVKLMLAHHQCQKNRIEDRNKKFCFADYLRNLEQLLL